MTPGTTPYWLDKHSGKLPVNVLASRKITPGIAIAFGAVLALILLSPSIAAAGTWAPLTHAPPPGVLNGLLLGGGTVVGGDRGQNWDRVSPDNQGGYVNGMWTAMGGIHDTRLFYAS